MLEYINVIFIVNIFSLVVSLSITFIFIVLRIFKKIKIFPLLVSIMFSLFLCLTLLISSVFTLNSNTIFKDNKETYLEDKKISKFFLIDNEAKTKSINENTYYIYNNEENKEELILIPNKFGKDISKVTIEKTILMSDLPSPYNKIMKLTNNPSEQGDLISLEITDARK